MKTLSGYRVICLAQNLPGPVAASRLVGLGAEVIKVEPPQGDPLSALGELYHALTSGMKIIRLDLKNEEGKREFFELLSGADLLLTAQRPAALERLGLGWESLHARFPKLCFVGVVGHAPPRAEEPGHDLTYEAEAGLVFPPALPTTLVADMGGAERAVVMSLALLFSRERGEEAQMAWVALAQAGKDFSLPLAYGLTRPGAALSGALAEYNLYRTKDGWIALAALEPHFSARVREEFGESSWEARFLEKTSDEWEAWARAKDIPLAAVREAKP